MSIFEHEKPQGTSREYPIRVAILGCSGSIGRQTIDVCRRHSDKLQVVALSVNTSTAFLAQAARELGATHAAVADASMKDDPNLADMPAACKVSFGDQAVAELACLDEVDIVVNALVGFAGILAGYKALLAGKSMAYANKESIVCGGDLLMPLTRPGKLIPVDSEHSAIFQCLVGERLSEVSKIWLTCSGGPFFGMGREELAHVTASQALAHPTWRMGSKITIDSATLMNKGLEVLEASQLFEVPIDDVRVLVHRQSKIHSMVEFVDGVVKAQLGGSDMRAPIQYALSFPDRWEATAARVDWCSADPFTFAEADEKSFGCLALAKEAGRIGGTMPCAMNAANEVANAAFRAGTCGFLDIEKIVSQVMERSCAEKVESFEQLVDVDARSRELARELLSGVAQ